MRAPIIMTTRYVAPSAMTVFAMPNKSIKRTFKDAARKASSAAGAVRPTTGRVAIFTPCYGNRNEPDLDVDLAKILQPFQRHLALLNGQVLPDSGNNVV